MAAPISPALSAPKGLTWIFSTSLDHRGGHVKMYLHVKDQLFVVLVLVQMVL